jgi:pyridoxine 4-dehydrogenase
LRVCVCDCGNNTTISVTQIENEDLQKVISTAYQSNGAFFDTAERYGSHAKTAFGLGYGETEKLTSKLLRRAQEAVAAAEAEQGQQQSPSLRRLAPVIATKFTPTPWRTTVQSMVDACEQSRTNLGVDQIDLYQIHMPDIVQPLRFLGRDKAKDSMYWDGLAECYHRGLVKNVGVCNYGPTLVAQCQEHLAKRGVPLASNQIGYSLVGRQGGAQETLDKCQELGVAVMAFYPFAMGLLTGKYTPEPQDLVESGTKSHSSPSTLSSSSSLVTKKKTSLELQDLERYAKGDGVKIPKGGIAPLIRTMDMIAKTNNKTLAQVALNYILCKGAIPIPGARTVEQLEDNLGAMGWRLSDTEVAMLELAADQLGFAFDGAGFKRTNEKFVGYGVEKFYLD